MIVPAKSLACDDTFLLTSGGWIVAAALTTLVVTKSNATNAVRNANLFVVSAHSRSPLLLPLAIKKLHPAQIELTYPFVFLFYKSGEDCAPGLQQQGRVSQTFQLSNFPQCGNGQAPTSRCSSISTLWNVEVWKVWKVWKIFQTFQTFLEV